MRAQRRGPSRFPPLRRPTQSLSLSLVQVTLEGHTGVQAAYMGVYELSAETDDGAPPRFVKRLANGKAQYLYRSSSAGTWVVTNDESKIAENRGAIFSLRAADLPSEAELGWKYYDGSFKNDPDLRCTDVRTHGHHRSGRRETTSLSHSLNSRLGEKTRYSSNTSMGTKNLNLLRSEIYKILRSKFEFIL